MKKLCILLFLFFLGVAVTAQENWTVKTVPNTRIESNDIHVSDPDGFLSDSAEMNINTALCAIRDKVDVFVVTLASIGSTEPKSFATELFNYWGIGDAETNNGVLLLFVEDQHALEFETGYGAEETLTDAKCEQVFTKSIVPFFRAGDYEGGLCSGVAAIVDVYGGEIPLGLKTTLPDDSYYDYDDDSDSDSEMGIFAMLVYLFVFLIPFISFIRWLFHAKDKKKLQSLSLKENLERFEENGAVYIADYKNQWAGTVWEGQGCLRAITFGLSLLLLWGLVAMIVSGLFSGKISEWSMHTIVAGGTAFIYLTLIALIQNLRSLRISKQKAAIAISPKEIYKAADKNAMTLFTRILAPWVGIPFHYVFKNKIKKSANYRCPTCGSKIKEAADFSLPSTHVLENQLQALTFRPYRCTNGHYVVVQEKGSKYKDFKKCDSCGAYTLKNIKTVTLVKADYTHEGEKKLFYECQQCGFKKTENLKIPKKIRESTSSYSGSSSRSYSSSSRSSGGSFGGGRSGGGGYSGRW